MVGRGEWVVMVVSGRVMEFDGEEVTNFFFFHILIIFLLLTPKGQLEDGLVER